MVDYTGVSDLTGLAPEVKADKDTPAYKYAFALTSQARQAAARYTNTFRKNWDFLLGKDHHQIPATAQAIANDEWRTKSIDNLLFAVVDNKAAVVGRGDLAIHVEDMEDKTTYYERLIISETLRQEAERLKWRRLRDDLFLQGSATGVGVIMSSVKPDQLTGEMLIQSKVMKSDEIYCDPEQDNTHDASYMVWEPTLPMPVLRQMFESKAKQIKPDIQSVASTPGGVTYSTSNDENLIYGSSGEFLVDSQSQLKARKAKTCFVWINDVDSIVEELKETVIKEETSGYQCTDCSLYHEPDALQEDSTDCPACGSPLVEATIPAKIRQDTVIRRQYPYGRLIVYSGDTLLFDGENPLDIEGCFPVSVYHHYRVPGCFYGWSDVALLWSNQLSRDVTIGQGVDYVRLAVNAPFEYPIGAEAYGRMGNAPGQPLPVRRDLCGIARRLEPAGFNLAVWQSVLGASDKSFQTVSGFTDLVAGFVGNPPPSGVAVEATTASTGGRIDAHVRRMEDALSDWLQQVWQLGHQYYEASRNVELRFPNSERRGVEVAWQKLPKNIKIRVSINSSDALADKNRGQNVVKAAEAGLLPSKPEIILPALGFKPAEIRELMDQIKLDEELKAQAPPLPPPPMPGGGPPELSLIGGE